MYSDSDMINRFHRRIRFSSIEREKDVIFEPCLEIERPNMNIISEPYIPYFYYHLPVIHELGDLILFIPFEAKCLMVLNAAPSQITPNV